MLVVALACSSLLVAPPSPTHHLRHPRVPSVSMRAGEPPPSSTTSLPLLLRPESGLAVGSSLLLLLVFNRLFTDTLLNSQSRADLIATVAPVLIVLKALADLDITPREAEPTALDGVNIAWVEPSLTPDAQREVEWAADTLIANPACAALALWSEDRTLVLRGTVPAAAAESPAAAVEPGTLLSKCMQRVNGAPDYLPALQLLPGRVEFSYFPSAAQGVLMLPLVGERRGALILACDRQRGFKEADVSWARAVAARLSELNLS